MCIRDRAVPYLLGGAAGGVLAGKLFGRLKADWLRRAFGVLDVYKRQGFYSFGKTAYDDGVSHLVQLLERNAEQQRNREPEQLLRR